MEQGTTHLPTRYEVRSLLGRGGVGAVYLAYDKDLSMDVAVKVLRDDKREAFGSFFHTEIRAAAQLCHPFIVPIYDAGQREPAPFLSMRYLSGGSLTPWLRQPPAWGVVRRVFGQILEALSFAHARGMLHRDLKPENILFSEEGDAFVADLGLALSLERVERTRLVSQEVYGSPRYMAPEQFLNTPYDLGPWTDLYSLGVILFELVSGQKPFRGEPDVIFSLKQSPPRCEVRAGYSVPRGLTDLIGRLLSPLPEGRFELAADLALSLEGLEQSSLVSESGPPSPLGTGRDARPPRQKMLDNAPESLGRGRAFPVAPPEDPRSEEATRASLALFPLRDFGLVGRAFEKKLLWEKAQEARDTKSPRVILLEGEAGVGKSRLLRWLRESLEQRGLSRRVLVREEEPKLGSLVGIEGAAHRLLRSYHAPAQEIRARALSYLGPHLLAEASAIAAWLSPQASAEPLSVVERDLLFFQLLYREAQRGMALLHWENIPRSASTTGLATIERALELYQNTQEAFPVLILATARPEDWAESAGARLRERLLARPEVTLLPVERLEKAVQARLIEERAPITAELAALLAERSEGNPLYAVELLKHWVMSGYLAPAGRGRYQLKPGSARGAAMPRSLALLSQSRVEGAISRAEAPEVAESSLLLAALLGLEPTEEALSQALEKLYDEDSARWGISFLQREGLLRWMDRAGVLRFEHALLHSLVLARAEAREDAAWLHRLCAESLEATRADAATLSAAGSHWEKAGEPLRAAQCFLRAGGRWRFSDLARAEEAYTSSLRLAQSTADASREELITEARLGLGRVMYMQSRSPEAEAHFLAALKSQDQSICALAFIGLGSLAFQSRDLKTAERYAEEAKRISVENRDRVHLAHALRVLGMVYLRRGLLESAAEALTSAQQEARTAGAQRELADTLRWLAQLSIQRGSLEQAEKLMLEAAQISSRLGHANLYAQLQNELGEVAKNRGNYEEARQFYLRYRSLAQQLGRQSNVMLAEMNLAFVALLAGNLSQGDGHIQRASALRSFGPYLKAPLALLSAWSAALEGDATQASALLEESLSLSVDKEADADTALVFERLGDASFGELAHKSYSLAFSQWRRLGREAEIERVSGKLAKLPK